MSTVMLVALGLAMLAVGIWVEDRAAVAAPLVIIGALAVVAGVIFGEWADIEQMSLGQSGFSVTRRPPTAEQLTEAGLPPEVAQEMQEWMDALIDALPGLVDKRVSRMLAERERGARELDRLARQVAEQQIRYGEKPPQE
jgi:hypothetical protein